jgi:hypothetical protein
MFTGISDFLKGKMSVKNALNTILDAFTSGIIDSFVNGLVGAITEKNGVFTKLLGGIGESLFTFGQELVGGATEEQISWGEQALREAAIAMTQLTNTLTLNPLFTNPAVDKGTTELTDTLQKSQEEIAWSTTESGRLITGAVNVVASNVSGGFGSVLRFLPMLLQSLTAGKMMSGGGGLLGSLLKKGFSLAASYFTGSPVPLAQFDPVAGVKLGGVFDHSGMLRLAKGGVISAPTFFNHGGGTGLMGEAGPEAVMPLTRDSLGRLGVRSSEQRPSQVFNINITGDVSRQTRAEIQRMIPEIAGGVNMHNAESGVRSR